MNDKKDGGESAILSFHVCTMMYAHVRQLGDPPN